MPFLRGKQGFSIKTKKGKQRKDTKATLAKNKKTKTKTKQEQHQKQSKNKTKTNKT